tara:strand:+ start:734 stop:1381 length:648 start_codon:yes stop_codon:yes gene_type:complete
MLIIFDCDGVLVDSELMANLVLAEYLTELGFPHTREECTENYVGKSISSIMRMIEDKMDCNLPRNFRAELMERDKYSFKDQLQAIPGVAEVIVSWAGLKCVASSSSLERIYNSLKITGLLAYFEPYVFSACQVAFGKPDPALFQFASEQMEVSAADCLVVEDSVPGVIAGKRAGMRVMGFVGGSHCGPGHDKKLLDAGADQVFDNMIDLKNEIEV